MGKQRSAAISSAFLMMCLLTRQTAYGQQAPSQKSQSDTAEPPAVEHVRHMRAHKKKSPTTQEKEARNEEIPAEPKAASLEKLFQ